jgi:hypothetical protein
MTDRRTLLLGALGLTIAGVLLLLLNYGWAARYAPVAQYTLAGLLAAAGIVVLGVYTLRHTHWGWIMPGWTLLALGGMLLLGTLPAVPRPLIAALLFGGLALAFAHIYLVQRSEHWWAIIPGGFMAVIAGVVSMSWVTPRIEFLAALLFIGMGLVFGLVYGLAGRHRHGWALIPGGVLVGFGLLVWTQEATWAEESPAAWVRAWPGLLLIAAALLALLATRRAPSPADKFQVNVARTPPVTSATAQGRLGDYSQPAPGASVEVFPDAEDR